MPQGLMLDTNIFNRATDGLIDLAIFEGFDLFATHIQLDELNKTHDDLRRANLVATFKTSTATNVATESFVWDISRWDECKWPSNDLCQQLFADIRKREPASKSDENCWCDALIADTAIKANFILVSEDRNLRDVVDAHNGTAMCIADFEVIAKNPIT